MPLVRPSRLAQSLRISTLLFQARNSQVSETTALPPQLQLRRYYGRMLRTIVSKHVASITDVVRPVLPPGIASLPKEVEKFTRILAPAQSREAQYVPRNSIFKQNIEAPEDDISTEPYSPAVTDTDIQTQVRKLMRLVPHPVAIITSTHPNSRAESAFRGMTVSSFNTVTLYPEPVVSFNAKVPSETYDAIRLSKRFLVHLLSSNAATANLAREFSRGHENILLEDKKHTFRFTSPASLDRLPAIHQGEPPRLVIHQGKLDNSRFPGSDARPDFPFILECKYYPSSAQVGDHVIVLGTVVKLYGDEPQNQMQEPDTTHSADELCLTYADTRFWKMGKTINPLSKVNRSVTKS
ncbi:hypothetical protein D8B26_005501 [Coccidioides posadasii str. Silveira]|uniref:Uncharacterized protein n=1 Tax=Coccidioides posadasii (strain RMSCC 757 / Silveira) TaxID=443226 RepID=E9D3N6_COCPS|nr:conserved hypothetical protein [Coccidioides posadasii str. Silveira]QVM10849.1 hypothetical protein D8B26_005501 [Coccidioides posadasii str. Silveira]